MIIGTRGSALALVQTRMVAKQLKERCPGIDIEVREIKTMGDKVTDRPLASLGGYGAFTKELDQRIVSGEIDAAVNSLKDMPVDLTPGTELAAVLPRGPVEDVLLSDVPLEQLPHGAVVGSSSVRRRSILLWKRPDLDVRDLRGNVPTRVRKWKNGEYDAIVLARAGLVRLGIDAEYHVLDPEMFTPAVGQGAIAVVCAKDSEHIKSLHRLDDPKTRTEVEAERFVLRALGGGCSVPIGVWATMQGDKLRVRGSVISEEGEKSVFVDRTICLDLREEGLTKMAETMRPAVGGCGLAR
ncbi:MAG: hydroxymethylbilane synthase [Methanomassiliicoccus sp.]|nr:hydroxymethylbilane synthase [Methanomassiliicoccus sp.]